ncbi:hypothetical protein KCU78_g14182, partial [Aureobasidium melanogenum]
IATQDLVWPAIWQIDLVDQFSDLSSTNSVIHNISPERNYSQLDPVPYFMAFDKDGPDEDSGYPGAMKVPLEDLMYLFEEGLERDNMRGLCLKSSEWFKRDEIDIGETYAED